MLPVGERPMLDWIADKIDEVAVVDELHVVTKRGSRPTSLMGGARRPFGAGCARRPDDLERRPAGRDRRHRVRRAPRRARRRRPVRGRGRQPVRVLARRLRRSGGAGSARRARSRCATAATWRSRRNTRSSASTRRPCGRSWRAAGATKHAGSDRDLRLPPRPRALIEEYLAGGNPPDAPGNLVAWLHTRRPVYGYRLEGEWFDVGDREQLLEADNWLRRWTGLSERDRYSL